MQQIDEEKAKVRSMWRMNCEYVVEQEEVVAAKDAEIARLKEALREPGLHSGEGGVTRTGTPLEVAPLTLSLTEEHRPRRGKAPPVDAFTGEGHEILLND